MHGHAMRLLLVSAMIVLAGATAHAEPRRAARQSLIPRRASMLRWPIPTLSTRLIESVGRGKACTADSGG